MRKLLSSLFLFVSSTSMLGLSPIHARERTGSITGTIADASGGVLPGARVELTPTSQLFVSNGQGQFPVRDLAPGNYKLTASYIGFAPFSTDVKIAAGQISHVNVVLQIGTQNEVVTVPGKRERGEVEAINIERTADNIVQVLPAEVITSLPNTNIADTVGGLPSVSLERDEGEGKYIQIRGTEPRLSNVTINGVNVPSPEGGVRNVKLDVIPSDLVDSIEVNKTLSANQDGDAIGGSVNLVTKTVGDEPYVSTSSLVGYTNIVGGRGLDQFTGTVGSRFGENRRLGVLIGG